SKITGSPKGPAGSIPRQDCSSSEPLVPISSRVVQEGLRPSEAATGPQLRHLMTSAMPALPPELEHGGSDIERLTSRESAGDKKVSDPGELCTADDTVEDEDFSEEDLEEETSAEIDTHLDFEPKEKQVSLEAD